MNIIAKSIEQDHQNETTRVWFDVNGESFCVAGSCGDKSILDSGGHGVEDSGLEDMLYPAYEKITEDYCGEDCVIDEEI